MPDVGVLSLQIQDNSAAAITGLDNLVQALGRVRDAVGQVSGITAVANGIKRIAAAVNENVNETTITRLGQLADEIGKLRDVGNVHIKLDAVGEVRKTMDTVRNGTEEVGKLGEASGNAVKESLSGFDDYKAEVHEVSEEILRMHEVIRNMTNDRAVRVEGVAKEAKENIKSIDYSKINMNDFMGDAVTALMERYRMLGTAVDEFRGRVDASIPVLRNYRDELLQLESKRDFAMLGKKTGEQLIASMKPAQETAAAMSENMNAVSSAITESASQAQELTRATQEANNAVSEQIRLRQKAMAAADQARLESNYEQYRELFMSGEGGWREQVPQMYGMAPKAIEENESYAEAMKATMQEVNSYVDEFIEKMNTPSGELLRDAIDRAFEAKLAFKSAQESAEVFRNAPNITSGFQDVGTATHIMTGAFNGGGQAAVVLTDNLRDLDGELRQKKTDLKGAADGAEEMKKSFSELMFGCEGLKGAFKRMFPTIAGLAHRFKSLLVYRGLRNVLKHIAEGFKTGYENFKQYSEAIGSDFSSNLNTANAQLTTMKNSIGAAIAPAIQAALPLLQTLTSAAITAFNAVNQLLSLLQGKSTWTKAVDATADSLSNVKKSAGGAGSAVKDLLASWDELNIIQSESGGGGGGGGGADTADYASMFEEVSLFDERIRGIADFMRDNMDQLKNAAIDIGAILLGWKFSTAFGGLLGTLGTIMAIGATMDLTWRITEMVDNEYIKTGEDGWLITDILTNAVGSTIAGYLASTILGTAGGLITAGFELAISGAISFGIGYANKDSDEGQVVQKVGLIKGLIGEALIGAGFYIGTGSIAKGFYGAGLMAPMFIAVAGITMMVETSKKEYEIAEEFFRNSGKGGISVEKLFEDLNTEFNRLAEPYRLSTEAFASSREATGKINEAFRSLAGLNDLITSGKMLTPEQAQQFKEAWTTVFTSFDEWSETNWSTIFEGFNAALTTESEELKEQAREAQILALRTKEGLSEVEASLKVRMNELMEKIMQGETLTPDEQAEYEKKMRAFMILADESLLNFKEIIETAGTVDFSDAEHPFEAAKQFVADASASYSEVASSIDAGLESQIAAIEDRKKEIRDLVIAGLLDPDVAKEWEENLDAQIALFTKIATANKEDAFKDLKESYILILNTAKKGLEQYIREDGTFDFSGAETYLKDGLMPLIYAMRDAGLSTEEMKEIFTGSAFDLPDLLQQIFEFNGDDEESWIKFILAQVNGAWEEAGKRLDLSGRIMQDLFGLEGWDYSSAEKRRIMDELIETFGFDTAIEAMADYYQIDVDKLISFYHGNTQTDDEKWAKELLSETIQNIHIDEYDLDAFGEENPADIVRNKILEEMKSLSEKPISTDEDIIVEIKSEVDFSTNLLWNTDELDEDLKKELSKIGDIDFGSQYAFERELVVNVKYSVDGLDSGYLGAFYSKPALTLPNDEQVYKLFNTPTSGTEDNERAVEDGVNRGTAQGFNNVAALLSTANTLLTALLNKQFVATVAPTAGTGHGLQTAINAFNNLTGNGV